MILGALACVVVLSGCQSEETTEQPKAKRSPLATAAPTATLPKDGEQVAIIQTNFGRIVFKFFPEKAPKTVENFVKLANSKFYDGTQFHRIVPKFVIQGGDPNSKGPNRETWGQGGPGYTIPGEMNDAGHSRGAVAMARQEDPDSAGSQFYITLADHPELDPDLSTKRIGYTVFGQVLEGMNVVDHISGLELDERAAPKEKPAIVESVRIGTWPLKD